MRCSWASTNWPVADCGRALTEGGSGSKNRPGFGRLLTAVRRRCSARAGSFPAGRNNRDWHHLIDLCVLTDALVIDGDGIYDPRQINDRLLL